MGYDRFSERFARLLEVDKMLEEKNAQASYILLDAENDLDKVIIKPKFPYPEPALEGAEQADVPDFAIPPEAPQAQAAQAI